jgi:hypothetical protein
MWPRPRSSGNRARPDLAITLGSAAEFRPSSRRRVRGLRRRGARRRSSRAWPGPRSQSRRCTDLRLRTAGRSTTQIPGTRGHSRQRLARADQDGLLPPSGPGGPLRNGPRVPLRLHQREDRDHEHRAGRGLADPSGNAAEQRVEAPSVAMTAQHHQVGSRLPRGGDESRERGCPRDWWSDTALRRR